LGPSLPPERTSPSNLTTAGTVMQRIEINIVLPDDAFSQTQDLSPSARAKIRKLSGLIDNVEAEAAELKAEEDQEIIGMSGLPIIHIGRILHFLASVEDQFGMSVEALDAILAELLSTDPEGMTGEEQVNAAISRAVCEWDL